MTTNTDPLAMPRDRTITGADITGTSDAIVLQSSPDVALPLESEPADGANPGASGNAVSTTAEPLNLEDINRQARDNPGRAIAIAAAVGLLLGVGVKKMFPARRRR